MLNARTCLKNLIRTPGAFAVAIVMWYLLSALPILARHGFDTSVFIVAGDKFVDSSQLISPILVQSHSDGYDGQFYYRMALSPFQLQTRSNGVQFDDPPWRTQRIMYPVLAWAVAFGRPDLVPATLFLVNLFGMGVIAFLTVKLTSRLGLPILTPLAVILWPGFIASLTHDTTEIVAAAFLVAALNAYFSQRLVAYAALGAAAALTRETSILFLAGVFGFEGLRAMRSAAGLDRWRRTIIVGLALVPFLIWREMQFVLWAQSPFADAAKNNVGWPFQGFIEMVEDALSGTRFDGKHLALRAYELGGAGLLTIFCAMVIVRLNATLRISTSGALAAGWIPIILLMVVLRASWVEIAFLRVCTECFVIGCLIIALRPPPQWVSGAMIGGCVVAYGGAWGISLRNLS